MTELLTAVVNGMHYGCMEAVQHSLSQLCNMRSDKFFMKVWCDRLPN